MTQLFAKQGRGLLALLAGLALAAAACGGSSGTAAPGGSGAPGSSATPGGQTSAETTPGGGGGDGLAEGLGSNLDNLDSYKYTYKYVAGATSTGTAMTVTGTVVNKPVKSAMVTIMGMTTIVVGDKAWVGFGGTWVPSEDTTFTDLVDVASDYGDWFDDDVEKWELVGEESKNGVACVHFKGDESLALNYAVGDVKDFKADLWVAKDGNYPVSGVFSFTVAGEGKTGMWGMTLDVTNVNDPANKVEAPKALG